MIRIVVVEDAEHFAQLITEMLGREGYAIEIASDGRSALMRALAEPFDLPSVAWTLPDLVGIQVVRRLRPARIGVLD